MTAAVEIYRKEVAQSVEAARHLPPGPAWTRARWLAEAIQRFEARTWPCWRALPEPPEYARQIERHLYAARLYGELPASQRALYRLLTEKVPTASATDGYGDTISFREETPP